MLFRLWPTEAFTKAPLNPNGLIYVIDDDAHVRGALANLFESVGLRAETFATTAEFLANWRNDAPQCLVLDVRLQGISGLEFQSQLGAANINIPIIFITGYGDIPMTVKAMKAGAVEFLMKPVREQDLLDAVRIALDNDRNRQEKEQMVAELRARVESLTPREREVMTLAAIMHYAARFRTSVELARAGNPVGWIG